MDPDSGPVLGSLAPVQDVQDTQEPSALHENSDSEKDTPSKGKISREIKALVQTPTRPHSARKAR